MKLKFVAGVQSVHFFCSVEFNKCGVKVINIAACVASGHYPKP